MSTVELNAGGNPGGSRNTPSRFMLQKPEISANGPLGSNAGFTFYLTTPIQAPFKRDHSKILTILSPPSIASKKWGFHL